MNRIKGYIGYLLIPAVPYLLMIFAPETIHPWIEYMMNAEQSKYVWCVCMALFLWGVYEGTSIDAIAAGVKPRLLSIARHLFILLGTTGLFYLLLSNSVNLKMFVLGMGCTSLAIYFGITFCGKKNA